MAESREIFLPAGGGLSVRDIVGLLQKKSRAPEPPPDLPPNLWVKLECESEPQTVNTQAAWMIPAIRRQVFLPSKLGLTEDAPIRLPKQVLPEPWDAVVEWAAFHRSPGRSDRERKQFDERLRKQLGPGLLCGLASASDALDMQPLVDLSSRGIARFIQGRSAEEIRTVFGLPDDLTEEEKMETYLHPLVPEGGTISQRQRLLQRLYTKKLSDLKESKAGLERAVGALAAAADGARPGADGARGAVGPSDHRSVEELLEFIGERVADRDGREAEGQAAAAGKKKKRHKRKGKKADGDAARAESGAGAGEEGSDAEGEGASAVTSAVRGSGGSRDREGEGAGQSERGEGGVGVPGPAGDEGGGAREGGQGANGVGRGPAMHLVGLPREELVRMLREGQVSSEELDALFGLTESNGASGPTTASEGVSGSGEGSDSDWEAELEGFQRRIESGLQDHLSQLIEASYRRAGEA